MSRLFVAVDTSEPVREALEGLVGGLPGARWVPPDQRHLTLAFLGEVEGALEGDLEEALGGVRAAPFDLRLRGVGCFPPRGEPRVAWAGVSRSEPLLALQRQVARALEQAGATLEHRKFHPHVTLARLKETPVRRVAEWLQEGALFESPTFTVEQFVLYGSELGSGGATHRPRAEFALSG